MRLALALVLLVLLPASALAHVTILPESSRPGQTAVFTFRAPNEREDSATIRLDVIVPPGVAVETQPHPGWKATRISDGVSWTADGDNSIKPGRTEDFKVKLGPLPDQPSVVFKALQYYADGQVVRWIQDPVADAERPAAVLDLTGRGVGTDGNGGAAPDTGTNWAVFAGAAVALLLIVVLMVWLLRRRGV